MRRSVGRGLRTVDQLPVFIIDFTISQTPCADYKHGGTSEKFEELNQCHRCWLACVAWRGRHYILNTQSSRCLMLTSQEDRKSTRLNSSHLGISYAVFCLKKKKKY